jgi:hypothetical protein
MSNASDMFGAMPSAAERAAFGAFPKATSKSKSQMQSQEKPPNQKEAPKYRHSNPRAASKSKCNVQMRKQHSNPYMKQPKRNSKSKRWRKSKSGSQLQKRQPHRKAASTSESDSKPDSDTDIQVQKAPKTNSQIPIRLSCAVSIPKLTTEHCDTAVCQSA